MKKGQEKATFPKVGGLIGHIIPSAFFTDFFCFIKVNRFRKEFHIHIILSNFLYFYTSSNTSPKNLSIHKGAEMFIIWMSHDFITSKY